MKKIISNIQEITKMKNNGWEDNDEKEINEEEYEYIEVEYTDFRDYTHKAINLLLEAGVTTNIHYVLSKNSIDEAITRIQNNDFPKGINAVVFLLYKPVGLGVSENVLTIDNPKVQEFYNLINGANLKNLDFDIGFDTCNAPALTNFCNNIDDSSMDCCESATFSAYIDCNMNIMPCSFCNQDEKYYISLKEHTIKEAWDSKIFEDFRHSRKNSCLKCPKRTTCNGGCPITSEITLCNNPEKDIQLL